MFLSSSKLRKTFSVLVLAAGFVLSAQSASACMCESLGSPKKNFDHAKNGAASIFVGRAVEVVNGITHGDFAGWRVKLKIERYWKGQLDEEVIVFTGRNDCAAHFAVGDEYLVLAYVPDGERDLYTNVCMKTGLVRLSANELKWLGKPKRR